MAAKYISLAVAALHARFVAQFETQLRQVETDESLAANSLTDPVAYKRAFMPSLNLIPMVMIYGEGLDWLDEREDIVNVECKVVLQWRDTDVVNGAQKLDRYVTAMIETIQSDYTLNDANITQAIPGRIETLFTGIKDDLSDTLFVAAMEVIVTVSEC